MKKYTTFHGGRTIAAVFSLLFLMTIVTTTLFAWQKYRTFNQDDLSLKKAKFKITTTLVQFTFKNDSLDVPVNSLHIRLNAEVVSIEDSGGFNMFMFGPKRKNIDLSGIDIQPGDSVTICLAFDRKGAGKHVTFWQWDTNGVFAGNLRGPIAGLIEDQTFSNPNGGTVRDYLYKNIITKPNGLVIGIPTPAPNVGWIRYKASDKKDFPHTGAARCFDNIVTGNGRFKAFVGELKNPHVSKHDNHLLGELHALKLAIIANDAGVTDPDTGTSLGNLIYNDTSNVTDPYNGMSIRDIAHLADSALTYCGNFISTDYIALDFCISRINQAFDGPYDAYEKVPLEIRGTHDLSEIPFLHSNPSPAAAIRPTKFSSSAFIVENVPQSTRLMQNYPNPFNPTTTIDFHLSVPSIVTLKVYNLLGQEIATLFDQEELGEGDQSADFNARELTSGVYFYTIVAQSTDEDTPQYFHSVKRMLLLK